MNRLSEESDSDVVTENDGEGTDTSDGAGNGDLAATDSGADQVDGDPDAQLNDTPVDPDSTTEDTPNPDAQGDIADETDQTGDVVDRDLEDDEDRGPDIVPDGTDDTSSDPDLVVDHDVSSDPDIAVVPDIIPDPDLTPDSNLCLGIECTEPDEDYCQDTNYLLDFPEVGECLLGECYYTPLEWWCSNGCGVRAGADTCNPDCRPSGLCCTEDGEFETGDVRCGSEPVGSNIDCESTACGADVLVEERWQYCTGTTPDCGVSNLVWEPPYVQDPPCGVGELCHVSGSSASCSACDYGCSEGSCDDCTFDEDCVRGNWCDSGVCRDCNVAAHCGEDCDDCGEASCSEDGAGCIECTFNYECGITAWCDKGVCQTCDTAGHCGLLLCLVCSGETPVCGGLLPGCVCEEGSCGLNTECDGISCEVCVSDDACGSGCSSCSGPSPRCADRGDSSECVECTSNTDCLGGSVCGANQQCVDPASCTLPPLESCSNGSQSRESCVDAEVVSRSAAESGTTRTGSLYSSRDTDDRCAGSDGQDHFYRIFMYEGERLSVTMDVDFSDGFDAVLVLFRSSTACLGAGCDVQVECEDDGNDSVDEDFSDYVASQDGWYIIKVDAYSSISSDIDDDYDLRITLVCNDSGCGCT